MVFSVKDVLIIDATIIIGLFILLSFQSISSSFIESESSAFKLEYDKAVNEYYALDSLVGNCNGEIDMSDEEFEEYLTDLGIVETKKICSKWSVEYVELGYYLQNLEEQGYHYGYLQQWDENGNIHTYEFYEYQPELYTTESEYLHNLATGPFYVNQMNLIMMIPFISSAAIASFNILYSRSKNQDEESNRASKWSVGAMGVGFIVLFIGLMVILNGFYEVYKPFLNSVI